jgi:hypothetical protein
MRLILIALVTLVGNHYVKAQDSTSVVDTKYREDQFYFGVTYNLLGNMPQGMSQNGFSGGFHLGFIRDMPVNRSRTFSFGLGLGLSTNSFNQNLQISKDQQGVFSFELLNDESFTKNKFSNYLIEFPFEIRWRNSTATSYKFWRIYSGFKLGYVFATRVKFNGSPENVKFSDRSIYNKVQYGLTLSMGYNTWNAYAFYALNPIFKDEFLLNGTSIDINSIKIGLIFYIL